MGAKGYGQISRGSSMKCKLCNEPVIVTSRSRHHCIKHHRFTQMRGAARWRGKTIPSVTELEALFNQGGLICPECKRPMVWRRALATDRVVTLQHYRDGSFGLVCQSCNCRHTYMPGDSFRLMPTDHKLCPACNHVKPRSEFYSDISRGSIIQTMSRCKVCSQAKRNASRRAQRETLSK